MAVTIEIFGATATIEDYIWTSEKRPDLAEIFNRLSPRGGPSGADPHPDHTQARYIIELLKFGRIIHVDPIEPIDDDPNHIY